MKLVAKVLFFCSMLMFLSTVVFTGDVVAQEEMTMKEYKVLLQEWADRETAANAQIAAINTEIADLESKVGGVEGEIKSEWANIYAAIGVSEEDVAAYREELNSLENELNALGALSPEDLFKRRKEIDALEAKLAEMKENKIYSLSEMRNTISGIEGKIAQLRANMPKGMYDEYTVMRGDYLWRIARKADIYGDPFAWVRVYSYNREQIKDADLIYPEQIFKIHRENGPNEYLVGSGDNLSKIAGSMDVMSDPTKWRELYEANKDIVGDEPSLIYPHQVLKIPSN